MDKKLKTEIDDVEIMIGKVMQIGVILAAVVIIFGRKQASVSVRSGITGIAMRAFKRRHRHMLSESQACIEKNGSSWGIRWSGYERGDFRKIGWID
ncbi:hypothetical protein PZ01_00220 [Lacticaseibacillus rhamnosus]|nr:hypothetical protein PZ01_00220 [Lacticaseibacillus rhamnosus]